MKRILSELIASTPVIKDGRGRPKKPTPEQIAQHLVANNVIVLPCAIGSTVWIVSKNCTEPYPAKFKLDDVTQIGRRVFLNREDAEKMLKGGYGK